MGGNSPDALAGTLTGQSILLVAELLLEGLDGLQGQSLLGDRTAEESGKVASGGVHLIGGGRNVEVLDEVLKDGDRLSGLLAGDGGDGGNVDGGHFGGNFGGIEGRNGGSEKEKAFFSKRVSLV